MPERIEQLLVEKGYLTERQKKRVEEMSRETGQPFSARLLVTLGYVTDEAVTECAGLAEELPVVRLSGKTVDRKDASLLPAVFIRKHHILPVGTEEDALILATSFPPDYDALEEAAILTGRRIKPVLASQKELEEAINAFCTDSREEPDVMRKKETAELLRPPIVRMVNEMIESAYRENASDIHVEPGREQLVIRVRINGDLVLKQQLDMGYHRPMVTRLKLIAGMDIAEKRLPQDGKYRYEREEISTDLRISTLPTIYGEKVVLRLLGNDRESSLMELGNLGMEKEQIAAFEKMLQAPCGMILVTGPTGSGKTTTLYAALKQLVTGKNHVVTVEDPVEKLIDGVSQVQVNPKAGLTFARSLRSILRQDPDVMMVGEMRDEETASIGVRAAITGHLVLTTLHTNDCASVVDRLRNMGIPPYMIAASLRGILAQRLVKLLCPFCRREVLCSEEERKLFCASLGSAPEKLWRSEGCPHCSGTGYSRRRAVYELMEADEELRELILAQKPAHELRAYQRKKGAKPLREYVLRLAAEGETDIREAKRLLYDGE